MVNTSFGLMTALEEKMIGDMDRELEHKKTKQKSKPKK